MAKEDIGSRFEIPLPYGDGPDEEVDVNDVYVEVAATMGAISMIADFLVSVGGDERDGKLATSRGRLRDGEAVVVTEVGAEVGATDSARIDEVASGVWAASSIIVWHWQNECVDGWRREACLVCKCGVYETV